MEFLHQKIEAKWQKKWEDKKCFKAKIDYSKPKFYALNMFPYPSGTGLHVGHLASYVPTEVISRYKRNKGFNVLHPIGWDAFGLPAEQYAIQTNIHPEIITQKAIDNFRKQLKSFGFSFDWSREISTCNPKFYKWTQFIFKKIFEKKLAYRKKTSVNWCPVLKTVLANEEVIDGKSERGGHPVFRQPMEQWMLRITAYAERLLSDLEELDWPEKTKQAQTHWIGKSIGMKIDFHLDLKSEDSHVDDLNSKNVKTNKPKIIKKEIELKINEEVKLKSGVSYKESNHVKIKKNEIETGSQKITIFTTRADTLFGVSFIVLAPEHPLVSKIQSKELKNQVQNYIEKTKRKSDVERQLKKEVTGAFTGTYAIHPLNKKRLPIWVSDYVLMDYGTGAIMGTPAHDQRDYDFAKKFQLPILPIIKSNEIPFEGDGPHMHSDFLDGLNTKSALEKINQYLEKKHLGQKTVQYKIRDWVFSRQRYWGEPFPLVYLSEKLNIKNSPLHHKSLQHKGKNLTKDSNKDFKREVFTLPFEELPVVLPKVANYEPTEDAKSPLGRSPEFIQYKFPNGRVGEREVDTMPGSAASSWYFLRYLDPRNNQEPFSAETEKYWMPVDLYVGGSEHSVGHLLYSRFWQKILFDLNLVTHKEPFKKLIHQGIILGSDGHRMSKSRGNTVNLDVLRKKYGVDALRMHILFLGPYDKDKVWSEKGIEGIRRFLNRLWRLFFNEKGICILEKETQNKELKKNKNQDLLKSQLYFEKLIHRTIKKVSDDIESFRFNTAISAMMELVNELYILNKKPYFILKNLVQLLSPFAPHLAEEIWEKIGEKDFACLAPWPVYDAKLVEVLKSKIGVQVNGRLRGSILVSKETSEAEALEKAKTIKAVNQVLGEKTISKIIYKKGKILNLIAK